MHPYHAGRIRRYKIESRVLEVINLVDADWLSGYDDGIDGKDATEQAGEYKIGYECGKDARWEILAEDPADELQGS